MRSGRSPGRRTGSTSRSPPSRGRRSRSPPAALGRQQPSVPPIPLGDVASDEDISMQASQAAHAAAQAALRSMYSGGSGQTSGQGGPGGVPMAMAPFGPMQGMMLPMPGMTPQGFAPLPPLGSQAPGQVTPGAPHLMGSMSAGQLGLSSTSQSHVFQSQPSLGMGSSQLGAGQGYPSTTAAGPAASPMYPVGGGVPFGMGSMGSMGMPGAIGMGMMGMGMGSMMPGVGGMMSAGMAAGGSMPQHAGMAAGATSTQAPPADANGAIPPPLATDGLGPSGNSPGSSQGGTPTPAAETPGESSRAGSDFAEGLRSPEDPLAGGTAGSRSRGASQDTGGHDGGYEEEGPSGPASMQSSLADDSRPETPVQVPGGGAASGGGTGPEDAGRGEGRPSGRFGFREEERRVREGVDEFAPRRGMTVAEIEAEQRRLSRAEGGAAAREAREQGVHEGMERGEVALEEDRAVEGVQRAWRGFSARRRVRKLRSEFRKAYERAFHGGLVVQRIVDPGTRQVYLLNTQTGVYAEEAEARRMHAEFSARSMALSAGAEEAARELPSGAVVIDPEAGPADPYGLRTPGRTLGGDSLLPTPGGATLQPLSEESARRMQDVRAHGQQGGPVPQAQPLAGGSPPATGGSFASLRIATQQAGGDGRQQQQQQQQYGGPRGLRAVTPGALESPMGHMPPRSPLDPIAGQHPPQQQYYQQREALQASTPMALQSVRSIDTPGGANVPQPRFLGASQLQPLDHRAAAFPSAMASSVSRGGDWATQVDPQAQGAHLREGDTQGVADGRALMHASTHGQPPPGPLPGQGSLDSLGPQPMGQSGQPEAGGQGGADETKSVGSVDAEDALEEGRLFHPDGTRKSSLREVVSGALRSTKYDSVAALLASSTGDQGLAQIGQPFGAGAAAGRNRRSRTQGKGGRTRRKGAKGKGRGRARTGTDRRGMPVQQSDATDEMAPTMKFPGLGQQLGGGSRAAGQEAQGEAKMGMEEEDDSGLPRPAVEVPMPPKRRREVCFNCWVMGTGAKCTLHRQDEEPEQMLLGVKQGQSVLACSNWNVAAIGRPFRAEEIHEVFGKHAASLRFDAEKQAFYAVEESRHPLYRALADAVGHHNERQRRLRRRRQWARSLMEAVRVGLLSAGYQAGGSIGRMMRLRGTLRNYRWSKKVRWHSAHRFPVAMLTAQQPARAQHRVTEANRKAFEEQAREKERQRQIETGEVLPDEDAEEQRRLEVESGSQGSGEEDGANQHVPVVLQRTRDRRRNAPRGAGVGLFLDVPTVRWTETTEGGVLESVGTNTQLAPLGGKGMLRVLEDGGGVAVTEDGDPTDGTQRAMAVREMAGDAGGPAAQDGEGAVRTDLLEISPELDDPVRLAAERRRRARRVPRFLTDSGHQFPVQTDASLPTTLMSRLEREGVVYADGERGPGLGVTVRPLPSDPLLQRCEEARREAEARGDEDPDAAAEEVREQWLSDRRMAEADRKEALRLQAAADEADAEAREQTEGGSEEAMGEEMQHEVRAAREAREAGRHGRAHLFDAEESKGPEAMDGPDQMGMGHRDSVALQWRYMVTLPPPRARAIREPRRYEPYEPRTVPVPVPHGTELRAAVEEADAYEATRGQREQARAEERAWSERRGGARNQKWLSGEWLQTEGPQEEVALGPLSLPAGIDAGTVRTEPLPSFIEKPRAPPEHRLLCTFFRITRGREEGVVGGLPQQVVTTAWVTTAMPPQFGGDVAVQRTSVGPVRVPDVVRMREPQGAVDIRDMVAVGRGHTQSWRAALGEEEALQEEGVAGGLEPVGETRVLRALRRVAFGTQETDAWMQRQAERRQAAAAKGVDGEGVDPEGDATAVAAQAADAAFDQPKLRGFVVFDSVDVPAEAPMYTLEPLVSPLDDRVPPTVTASTLAGYFVGRAEAQVAAEEEAAANAAAEKEAGAGETKEEGSAIDRDDGLMARGEEEGDGTVAVVLREGVQEPQGTFRGGKAQRVRVGVTARGRAGAEVLVVGRDAPLFYGPNREEQTGEGFFVGFRTAEVVRPREVPSSLEADTFTPSEEVATSNQARPIAGTTTHADRFYPFAEPSTAPNTAKDFIHLLLTARPFPPEPQVFTALGHQEGGEFLLHGDPAAPSGPLEPTIYRSFRFAQTGEIQEFRTKRGVPYWYNRRTGETYWEPPLPPLPDPDEGAEAEEETLLRLRDQGGQQLRLEDEHRTHGAGGGGEAFSLEAHLPRDLYARHDDGSFVHQRLLTPRGSLRADAEDTLRADADADRAHARRLALQDGSVSSSGAGGDAGDMVPVPRAVAGMEADGVMGDDGTVRGGGWQHSGRAGPAGYSKSGLDLPGETLAAGPYTQERMRQHVLAPRDGEGLVDGRTSTVRGGGGVEAASVAESRRSASTLGPRAVPGRQPGAVVIAEEARFARQAPSEAGVGLDGNPLMMPPQAAGFERQAHEDEARAMDEREAAGERSRQAMALAAEAEAAREGTSVVDARAPHTIRPGRYGPAIAGTDGALRGVAERAAPGSGITGEPRPMGGGPLHDMGAHPGVAPGPPSAGAAGQGALSSLEEAGGGGMLGGGQSGVGGGAMVPAGQAPQDLAASIASALQSVLPQLQQSQGQAGVGGGSGGQSLQDLLSLGLGLGLGIGMQRQGQGQGQGQQLALPSGSSPLVVPGMGTGMPPPLDVGGGGGRQFQPSSIEIPPGHRFQGHGNMQGQAPLYHGLGPAGEEDAQGQAGGEDGFAFAPRSPMEVPAGHSPGSRSAVSFADTRGTFADTRGTFADTQGVGGMGGPVGGGEMTLLGAARGESRGADGTMRMSEMPRLPTQTPDEASGPNARGRGGGFDQSPADSLPAQPGGAMAPYHLHGAAGAGDRYVPQAAAGGVDAAEQGLAVRSMQPRLPRGFVTAVTSPATASQHADYLPQDPNTNKARVLGVVAPRRIVEDWAAVGFDPWSAGRRLRVTTLVTQIGRPGDGQGTALPEDEDEGLGGAAGGGGGRATGSAGDPRRLEAGAEANLVVQLFSLARNSRFDELEALLNTGGPGGGAVNIETRDETGNSLLLVAAQNGNRRILKLCLRRGANINARNNAGNTALHFCYSYGFEELGEYLKDKGADDTMTNLEGLTPYEGISREGVETL